MKLHSKPPKLLQEEFDINCEISSRIDGENNTQKNKQVNQKLVEVEPVEHVQQGMMHKQLTEEQLGAD